MARAAEDEEEQRNTPPYGPSLVLQVVGRAEVLLLSGSAAATHMVLRTPNRTPTPNPTLPLTLPLPLTQLYP